VPILEIDGAVPADENVESIIAEYWLDDGVSDPVGDPDSIPWAMAGTYSPSTTQIQITSVVGGETYYAALTYVVSGEPGDRLVLGPVTVSGVTTTPYRRADTTLVTADTTTRTADLG
jgi:hypothetical protein